MSDNPDLRLCTIAEAACFDSNVDPQLSGSLNWIDHNHSVQTNASSDSHGSLTYADANTKSFIRESTPLEKAVEILNEAMQTVPGVASHLHWPLPMLGDAEKSRIECFNMQDSQTTNILGILNGILSYREKGVVHRVEFSKDENRYYVSSVIV